MKSTIWLSIIWKHLPNYLTFEAQCFEHRCWPMTRRGWGDVAPFRTLVHTLIYTIIMDWNLNNATHSLNPRKIPLRGTFRSAWVRVWAQIMRRINGINLSKTDRRVHKLCLNGMLTSNRKLLLRSSRTTPEVNLFDKKITPLQYSQHKMILLGL